VKLRSLEIENFKGIKTAGVDFAADPPGNIITLIGLNESGKTTVLEAISHFVSVDEATSSIVETVASQQRPIDLIPKSKKSNFTGEISIRAKLSLDDEDKDSLCRFISRTHGYHVNRDSIPSEISVRRVYKFIDSDPQKPQTLWLFKFNFTKRLGGKIHVAQANNENVAIWSSATGHLSTRFPKILYFPTFLFKVPDRIYLEDLPTWEEGSEEVVVNNYYRQVLQDVADSLGDGISIKKHIVDRIARQRDTFPNPVGFFAALLGMDEASQVRAVINRLSGTITRTVFGAWNEIFDHGVQGKSVRLEWSVDTEQGNIPYVQLMVYDGEQNYAIHERSLGFRWFFTFLLFTQFRKSRVNEQGTIFLFDEPASNLHARAQMKLLDSFAKTASDNQYIVYSTHSHYMIDPMLLEKAYIVENRAIDFEKDDTAAQFEDRETDIRLTRYRQFVAKYPKRISYYQPALDALRFSFGPLVPGEYAIIVEGKYDFHPLRYFQTRLNIGTDVKIFPAPSASEAGTLISLMRGLGTAFVVMLDDDRAGKEAAKRYKKEHLLGDDQVFTLAALNSSLQGKSFEAIYTREVTALAPADSSAPTKGQYSLLFQQLYAKRDFKVGLGQTTNKVKAMLEKLEARVKDIPIVTAPAPKKRKK
jgi:ABC-type Na+ transport system ATPase subunit NatA